MCIQQSQSKSDKRLEKYRLSGEIYKSISQRLYEYHEGGGNRGKELPVSRKREKKKLDQLDIRKYTYYYYNESQFKRKR